MNLRTAVQKITDSDGRSADSTAQYKHLDLNPDYIAYRQGVLSPVWAYSERMRFLLYQNPYPDEKARQELATAITDQLSSLELFRQTIQLKINKQTDVCLFTILFPGEAKDNTGIKDLNDKILEYQLNNRFIECRQKAIATRFWQEDYHLPPKFVTVGQDYKSAQILSIGMTRKAFAEQLRLFDDDLKCCLLPLLDEAEKEAKSKHQETRLANIRALRNKLTEKKYYRFDFLFGARAVDFDIKDQLQDTFLMITEALKGAGTARFLAKVVGSQWAHLSKGIKADAKEDDDRGKRFVWAEFFALLKKPGDIKDIIRTTVRFLNIFVDKVWTIALYEYRRRLYVMNPDVVRDVRKKVLDKPRGNEGLKGKRTFESQKALMETWLVSVNALDYVKDFLSSEFKTQVATYHKKALAVFANVRDYATPVMWRPLREVLTRDFRQGPDAIAVLGNTSEFMFYSRSSDHHMRIFFSFDVRDLGVQVALLYDYAIGGMEFSKPKSGALMDATFASTDMIVARKRFTYEKVVETFEGYMDRMAKDGVKLQAANAFGHAAPGVQQLPSSTDAFQVMIGGDEIFVAAHPFFAKYVHEIVASLNSMVFNGGPLDLRAGVAFSRALISLEVEKQKQNNWEAHDQAFGRANSAANTLKYWERANRRMQRLIGKLEANPKKAHFVGEYSQKLDALGLTKLFARSNYGAPVVLESSAFAKLMRQWSDENVWGTKNAPELMDFAGNVVDANRLKKSTEDLEKEIAAKVWPDNYSVDPPPLVTSIPKWIDDLLSIWLPKEKPPYDKDPMPGLP